MAKIRSSASVFLVRDVVAAAEYYRDALGFRFTRYWGDPPDFCMVWRGEFCIMLARAADASLIRPVSTVHAPVWDAYFWVDDADGMFAELRDRGARVDYEPTEKPYGVREFAVFDLDGYQIGFGQEHED